jgi:hypothetical protein
MNWQQLLAANRVRRHVTSRQELTDLRAVIARDLQDAALTGLSVDRRFAIAYNAVLQLSKMVIACAGYRVVGQGHHQTTFEALELAMGQSIRATASYFDICRRKRNLVDYDLANVATETETEELLRQARQFAQVVEAWIAENHPAFVP